ncbi:nitroreductase [Staphylococcus sp. Marseille-Q5304]|uniref:nitroreductase family protein n=1 Tax=Staphylococcus sp. Marseille-Q5304 TaxID=2942200 RepID=UPI0020742E1F|nr:nitroreductase [Staphylococcus sp. Marseille-Q5304]
MELQEAIAQRRSIKIFKRDMNIDDNRLYEAIDNATDAPNHGLRQPWRIVHITKDRLGEMSKQLTKITFPDEPNKQKDHYDTVTNLGGMLTLIVKEEPDVKDNLENHMAFGAFAQNLMLLLHEAGIGSCWKTPKYIFNNKDIGAIFNLAEDEKLVGFLYLTDLEVDMPHPKRKKQNFVQKF